MKSFVLLALFCATVAADPAFRSPNDVDDVIVEGSKAFSLLLPAIALPYAVALIAVLVPLAKAFVLGAMNVLNLPFEVLVALYLLLYVALFTFPQLESLLKVTSVFTARSESARATGATNVPTNFPAGEAVMKWARNFVPESWMASIMSATATVATMSEATTTESAPTTRATAEPAISTLWFSTTEKPEVSPLTSEAPAAGTSTKSPPLSQKPNTSSECSSFQVCDSVSRLVKDYPVSLMLMGYLSDYLKGLKYERAVREGMADLNCTSIYPHCTLSSAHSHPPFAHV
ncbi:uncharacterized protein LOC119393399 [Rhipicephalus sanguineus]|uniref:Uncharacterized protein n=1 Tax=Rhipicephalus sanguineus TaxID=34632 RepID=A0A9D4YRP4_RHISA|nr:uncharacterized protein LOC119377096 [Rhipicephalus sanguineus]XP_037516320.1 uncharacterized protein LOC119393399 [Rhipicephalus sanguineus]KAH7950899.1 hypothetical protein HPB52_003082 [Rhipicephalus sanguineus]KAH7986615.1 hypothetical protein HPB52_024838 [Rhipicephalus sanguineus]